MLVFTIALGSADQLSGLFSYPNIPGGKATLAETIRHWVEQSLHRDGLTDRGARANVTVDGANYSLSLIGPPSVSNDLLAYQKRLPQFLANGAAALNTDIPAIKAANLWDPQNDGWRFMLPLGMAMVRQRALQLFHYPPINLLDPSRNYLNDAVPVRCDELLAANGVTDPAQQLLLSRVLDSAPVAAGDDQGPLISQMVTPTDYFADYQRAQIALLLTPCATNPSYTIPMVVYGAPARAVFAELFGVTLGVNEAATVPTLPGTTTAVLAANHPYAFYAVAQIGGQPGQQVGSGTMIPANCPAAQQMMVQDLIAAGWLAAMADDPTADPQVTLITQTAYWNDASQAAQVCALVQHEGSLFYPTGNPAGFTFKISLEQGASFCSSNGDNPCASAVQATQSLPSAAAEPTSGVRG